MNKQKRKLNYKILIIVILLLLVALFVALTVRHFTTNAPVQDVYEEIQSVVEETTVSVEEGPDYSPVVALNPDTVGWITIPNTTVNYPVVQYSNNDYYISHNFEKERDRFGSIFMDYRNNPIDFDANTIIYGHNCYNGTMFSELAKYLELDFYKQNPVFEFNTLEKAYKWKIYGVFITSAKPEEDNGYVFNYIYPYMDGENFTGFINEVNLRRLYVTDVDITDDDKMLVLSTCIRKLDTYKSGIRTYKADGRFVIVARAVRENESETVDVSKAYKNVNVKYPQIYYDNRGIENPYKYEERWFPIQNQN